MLFKGILHLAVLTCVLAIEMGDERESPKVTSMKSRSRRAEAPATVFVDSLPLSRQTVYENGLDRSISTNTRNSERVENSDDVLKEYKKQSISDKLVPVTTYRPHLTATSYQSVMLPGRIPSQYGGIHENKSDTIFGINRSTSGQIVDQRKQGTLTHITIRHPIPRHRVIEQRMTKPRVDDERHRAQITDERQQENDASIYSTEAMQDSLNPLHSFNSQQENEPLHHQHEPEHSKQKSKPDDRTSAFDTAGFSILNRPKLLRFPIRQPSTGRQPNKPLDTLSLVDQQQSDPEAKDAKDSSRNSKPLTFHLGRRRRLRFPRPIQNKNLGNQRFLDQSSKRTNLNENGRLDEKSGQQITSQEVSLDSDIPVSSDNMWMSIHKSNKNITSDSLPLSSKIATVHTTTETRPILKTIGNVTLSLQRARELFSRAQERYKALSQSDSHENSKNANATIDFATTEPAQHVSFSYSKIRHNDGSITETATPSISTKLPTKPTLPETFTDIPLSSAEYHTTSLPITTLKPQLTESYESTESSNIDKSSQVNSNIPESSIDELSNQSSLAKIDPVNIESETEIIGIDYEFNSSPTSTEIKDEKDILNESVTPFVQPATITKAEPISSDADDPGILSRPTIPPPVYKNSPFDATQFPALKDLNLFGLGNSNQPQPGLFQPQGSLKAFSPGSQTTNLSNLFGLGSFPEFGGVSSNLGNIGSFGHGQIFGSSTNDASQFGTGIGSLGYLGLLSGLGGINLGQTTGSQSPELSLPKLSQDGSSQHTRTGLGLFSGLSSLNLGGLGNFGDSGSLGTSGSIPGLHSLTSGIGTKGSNLDGLSGFRLSQDGSASALQGGSDSTLVNFPSPVGRLTETIPGSSQVEAILNKLGNSKFLPSIIPGSGALSPTSGAAALSAVIPPAVLPSVEGEVSVLPTDTKAIAN